MPKKPKKIHPDLKESEKKTVDFDQKGCRFTPHCLLVRTDQEVLVKSGDPIAHNTHPNFFKNQPINILIPPNEREGIPVGFQAAEVLPMPVKCDLHPHMTAHWLILDHPYAAITAKDGSFTIKGVPAGTHEFRVWHERVGYVNGTGVKKGKWKITVERGGVTEMESVLVKPEMLEPKQ